MTTIHYDFTDGTEVSYIEGKRLKDNFTKRGDYIVGDAQLEAELAECNLPEVFKKKALAE